MPPKKKTCTHKMYSKDECGNQMMFDEALEANIGRFYLKKSKFKH